MPTNENLNDENLNDENLNEPPEGEPDAEVEDEFSLDDLGAAYARAMAESGLLPSSSGDPNKPTDDSSLVDAENNLPTAHESTSVFVDDEDEAGISPLTIIEAALFVGHPENRPLTAGQIAATMRGVSADEVDRAVTELNVIYQRDELAFEIHQRDGGYVFGLRESMRSVRSAFYGKIRETRLTQAAVDVLALVAYQPGITTARINDQRGKDSGAIVNQMVRRELLEMRRELSDGVKPVPCFYPTRRLLNLLGLESLSDLPQVDEHDMTPR